MSVVIDRLLEMPGRSALSAAVDPSAIWTVESHLLAKLFDVNNEGNWLFAQANSPEDTNLPMPKSLPRPGVDVDDNELSEPVAQREFASPLEVAQLLAGMNTG